MFAATVGWGNRAKLWHTTPMPRRSVGRRATSWPSIRISPAIGRSSPRMHRKRVVFPPPEGPRIAASSPSRIPKLTSLRTSWPSKAIFSLRTSRVGMPWRPKGVVVEIRAESLLWNVWMILSTADLYQSEGRRGRATELAGVPAMAGPRSFRVTGIWMDDGRNGGKAYASGADGDDRSRAEAKHDGDVSHVRDSHGGTAPRSDGTTAATLHRRISARTAPPAALLRASRTPRGRDRDSQQRSGAAVSRPGRGRGNAAPGGRRGRGGHHRVARGTKCPSDPADPMATGGGTREPRPRERRGFAVPPRPVPGGPTRVEAAGREHGSGTQPAVIPARPPRAHGEAGARPPGGARRRVLRIPPEGHDGRGEPLPGNRAKHVRTAPEPRRASRRPCAAAHGADAGWPRGR